MPVKLNSSGGGSVTIDVPSTASAYTLTAPAATATLAVNGPAFRAKKTTNSNITSSTFVKLTFDATDFNVGSCYDTSTSRFTPTVAGYYNITAAIGTENGTTISRIIILLYKNGGAIGNYLQDIQWASGNAAQGYVSGGSDLIYLNGTSDYIEVYAYLAWSGGTQGISQATNTRFSGFLVRSA
jgi:hypothetical protein